MIIPYLTFNYMIEGDIVPMSGRVKLFYLHSYCPTLLSYLSSGEWAGMFWAFIKTLFPPQIQTAKWFGPSVLLIIFAIGSAQFAVWSKRNSRLFPSSIRLFSLVIVFHIIFMHFFYRELRSFTSYYFVPELLWFIMVLTIGVNQKSENRNNVAQANGGRKKLLNYLQANTIIALLAIGFAGMNWSHFNRSNDSPYWVQRMNLAKDINRIVSKNESLGAF